MSFRPMIAYAFMQCGQDELHGASHPESPGRRRKTWPWVHAVPRASSVFFFSTFSLFVWSAPLHLQLHLNPAATNTGAHGPKMWPAFLPRKTSDTKSRSKLN